MSNDDILNFTNNFNKIINGTSDQVMREALYDIGSVSNVICPFDPDHDFGSAPLHLRESLTLKQGGSIVGNGTESGKVAINMNTKGTTGEISYDNNYAIYVHELPSSSNFTTPGTGPKFLEIAATSLDMTKSGKKAFKKASKNWGVK